MWNFRPVVMKTSYRIRWHRGMPNQICFKHLKSNAAPLGDQYRRANSGGVPLRHDSKICLMVALVVMAYVLSIQLGGTPQGLENKVDKKKSIKINPLGWQLHISGKGSQSSKLKFGL